MDSGGSSGTEKPVTLEEEVLRRNTDCVYFLASPLTCKKGVECEFRHSEGARLNPRDCWYWMNANCLNPNCSYRHPPLDGIYGIPGTSASNPPTASTEASTVKTPAAYSSNKQTVPCYYYQMGHCRKGDRCPFMHGPQPTGNPPSQPLAKACTSIPETPQMLKDTLVLKQCTSQQNALKINANRAGLITPSSNPITRAEDIGPKPQLTKVLYHPPEDVLPRPHFTKVLYHPPDNVYTRPQLTMASYHSSEDMQPRPQRTKVPVSSSSDPSRPRNHLSQPIPERLQNGREADELLRESSPGFDVLVDDNAEGFGYFGNEDEDGRALDQGRRKRIRPDDVDYQYPDYEPAMDFERKHNRMGEHDQHLRDQRASSERFMNQACIPERQMQRSERADEIDGSDLRHRLKQRRLNSSGSAVSADHGGGSYRQNGQYAKERYGCHNSRRDQCDYHLESSIGSRLQGRLTIPRRSSPDRAIEMRSERERDRRRLQGRLSPGRPRPKTPHGRHREIMKRRSDEVLPPDGRSSGGGPVWKEDANLLDFAGPKSLAELKGAKGLESSQGHKGMKLEEHVSHQESEASLLFESPKPLSAILKSKREAVSETGVNSSTDGNSSIVVDLVVSDVLSVPSHQAVCSSIEPKDKMVADVNDEEESQIHAEDEELLESQYSAKEDIPETEVMVDNMEELGLEISDHGNAGSYYKAVAEGADFKTEADKNIAEFKIEDDVDTADLRIKDNENAYQYDEEEDMDDDNDFAKKVGLMFS